MLVSHPHRFIFLKSRKTASTSVEMLFQPFCMPPGTVFEEAQPEFVSDSGIVGARGGPNVKKARYTNHMSALEVQRTVGTACFDRYFCFTTIRNPFDQLVSWYHYENADAKNLEFAEMQRGFRRFLLRQMRKPLNAPYLKLKGQDCLNDVIRYEALREDIERVAHRLKLDIAPDDLPKTKTAQRGTKKIPYQTYYGSFERRLVEWKCRYELDRFGYRFDEQHGATG